MVGEVNAGVTKARFKIKPFCYGKIKTVTLLLAAN